MVASTNCITLCGILLSQPAKTPGFYLSTEPAKVVRDKVQVFAGWASDLCVHVCNVVHSIIVYSTTVESSSPLRKAADHSIKQGVRKQRKPGGEWHKIRWLESLGKVEAGHQMRNS